MDADNSSARVRAPSQGGSVEPANRAAFSKERVQTPDDSPGARYELRDPFAEVTYRANTFPQMVAKAEQLGSSRFVAVAEDGERTLIMKVDGEWQREIQGSPAPERPLSAVPTREAPEAKTVITMPAGDRAPAQKTAPRDQSDAETIAKIDAQAERAALVARLEAALTERYIIRRAPVTVGAVTIGRTEYRFRGEPSRVAFTESTFRLATDTNSPSVARSMVDVAEARDWRALRVSGNEDFKRMVWLEASLRGVKTVGYEAHPADLEVLRRQREARLANRIEPERTDRGGAASAATDKVSGRGGGRKAVLAAIEAVLVAKRVPETQRAAVMAAATEKLAQRIHNGQPAKVKVYDKSALSQRPVVASTPEMPRSRERATPAPVR